MPRRNDQPGFSRRDFLKTVGAGGVAAGVLTRAPGAEAQTGTAVGPGDVPMTLIINGRRTGSRSSRASRCSTRSATASTSPASSASATAGPAAPAR